MSVRLQPALSGIHCCPTCRNLPPGRCSCRLSVQWGRSVRLRAQVSSTTLKNCPRVISVDGQGWGKPLSPPGLSHGDWVATRGGHHRPLLPPLAQPRSSGSQEPHMPQHCWCPLPAPHQMHSPAVHTLALLPSERTGSRVWEVSCVLHSEPAKDTSLISCTHSPST